MAFSSIIINGYKLKACKCGSINLSMWDCGYSSFNVGGVKCNTCGFENKLDCCGCFPDKELAEAWNEAVDKKKIKKRLQSQIKELQKELKKI